MRREKQMRILQTVACSVVGIAWHAQAVDTTYTWVGTTSQSWSVATNWTNNDFPKPVGVLPDGDTQTLLYEGALANPLSAQTITGSSSNPGDYDIKGIIVHDYTGSASLQINTGGTGSRVLRLGSGGIYVDTTASLATNINGSNGSDRRLLLTADQSWTNLNATAPNIIVRRQIDDGDADYTITKMGEGTLQITNASGNLWSGGLNLNEGQIRLDTGSIGLLGTGTVTVGTSNQTAFSASGTAYTPQTITNKMVLSGGGTFLLRGSWELDFTGEFNFAGDKVFGVNKPSGAGAGTSKISGPITGSGKFTKANSGTLIIEGDASGFVGDLAITNGVISVGTLGQLGAATTPISLGSGTNVGGSAGNIHVRDASTSTSRALITDLGGGQVTSDGTVTVNNTLTGAGTFTKSGAGAMTSGAFQLGAPIDVAGGSLTLKPDGSDAGSNHATAIVLAGAENAWTTKLDVNNNHTVIEYSDASPIATIGNQIKSGYAAGSWNGNGITSSAAAAQLAAAHKTALGYGESTELGIGTFAGQTLTGTNVLIRYTWSGDADLNGKVNTLDFNRLAGSFSTGTKWSDGDFNYDGVVDSQDFGTLVGNYGLTTPAPTPSLGTVVPEPAAFPTLILAGWLTMQRKRR